MAIGTIVSAATLTYTKEIDVPIDRVYAAFVNRDDICDWLCYNALIRAEAGGHMLLYRYNNDHYWRHVYGLFTEVEENRRLVLDWQDNHDHCISRVEIEFFGGDDSTILTLTHTGLIDDTAVQHYDADWHFRLNNLKSILETGAHLDITDRVIIGVYQGPFNEGISKQLGVPVSVGARVVRVVEGYSAEAAGIQADDVIVEVDGWAVTEETTIHYIIRSQGKRPGDIASVAFYRGNERHCLEVELKGHPVPDVPANFAALAGRWEAEYKELHRSLTLEVDGISDRAANYRRDEQKWNIKQTIAQLILQQRHTLEWLSTYIEGPRLINPYVEVLGRIDAIVAVNPTVEELLATLRRTQAESIAILRNFPQTHDDRIDYLWWITWEAQYGPINFRNRLEQIRSLREAAAA